MLCTKWDSSKDRSADSGKNRNGYCSVIILDIIFFIQYHAGNLTLVVQNLGQLGSSQKLSHTEPIGNHV